MGHEGDRGGAGHRPQYGPSVSAGCRGRPAGPPVGAPLSVADQATAQALFQREAEGNAVVVQQLLAERGCGVSVRTVQRAVAPVRQAQRAAAVATVRVETP